MLPRRGNIIKISFKRRRFLLHLKRKHVSLISSLIVLNDSAPTFIHFAQLAEKFKFQVLRHIFFSEENPETRAVQP